MRAWLAAALVLALIAPAAAVPRAKTRFDGIRDCERLGAAQFRRHDPTFRRFVIDRSRVSVDRYATQIGSAFISTIFRGLALYDAGLGPRSTRFICLHGGVGQDAVFVYTLPE